MPSVLTPEVAEKIRNQSKRHANRIGFTGLRMCYLGNGLSPSTVVVPETERAHEGAYYVYEHKIDNKAVFQAICNNPGLTYDNSNADMPVWVGYPPGIDENSGAIPHILPFDPPEANTYTGGAKPSQIQGFQQQWVYGDRYRELKVFASGSGGQLVMADGRWRDGNTMVEFSQAIIVDLTSYIPATSGKSKYVLLTINSDLGVTVTEGSEVNTADLSNADQPTTAPDGELQIAYVQLNNGQATIVDDDITNIQAIPVVFSQAELTDVLDGTFALTDLSNLSSPTAINQHLLPATDATYDNGDSSNSWRRVYAHAINFQDANTFTLSSDTVTLTAPIKTNNVIAAESGTADDLVTISLAATNGDVIILRADSGDTITLKETGNLSLGGANVAMTDTSRIMLMYNSISAKWHMVGLTSGLVSIAASQITAGTFGSGAYTIQHATATGVPLSLKSTDDSTTNVLLRGLSSANAVTWSISPTGTAVFGKTSGGTYNANLYVEYHDQYATLYFRSGTTPYGTIQMNGAVASGYMYYKTGQFDILRNSDSETVARFNGSTLALYVGKNSNANGDTTGWFNLEDATTNAVNNVFTLSHNSTGTPATNFGGGFIMKLESSTTTFQSAARLRWLWTTATHASRTARGVLSAYDSGGERDCFSWEASGSAAMFAFAGANPSAVQTGYTTFTNLSTDRTCDANATTVDELADILGTLIEDLKTKNIISA